MSTVAQIAESLASRVDPATATPWDPVGLQIGDPEAGAETVAVCHEVTEEVIEELQQEPVDLLVTYHPLLFHPTTRIVAGRSAEARAYRLVKIGVALLVTHTDFDAAPGGTADALAEMLGLLDVEPFGGDEEEGIPAIGRIGEFDANLGALDAMLSDEFGHAGLRISGDRELEIDRLAVVPGSGADLIPAAAGLAQAIVTGDVPHHKAVHAADLGLAVADPGHIATEKPGMEALVELVKDIAGEVRDLTGLTPQTWS